MLFNYTFPCGRAMKIRIDAHEMDNRVIFTVRKDRGIALPDVEQLEGYRAELHPSHLQHIANLYLSVMKGLRHSSYEEMEEGIITLGFQK